MLIEGKKNTWFALKWVDMLQPSCDNNVQYGELSAYMVVMTTDSVALSLSRLYITWHI